MKIDIITLQAIKNYGSVLQAFATQKIWEQYGCDVEIINYVRENAKDENLAKKWSKGNPVKYCVMLPTIRKWKYIFGDFCKTQLNLTDKIYTTDEDFNNFPLDADIYCTGSDQVWNSKWNQGIVYPLYLSFVPDSKLKISFSSSFGRAEISQEEIIATKEYLGQYNFISVREDEAKDIIEKKYGLKAVQILDPTLMLPQEFWRKYTGNSLIRGDYILIYNLFRNKKFDDFAVKLSKYTGLKLVRICTRYDQFYRPGKHIFIPEVFEYVNLIDNAQFVITDSFHATAFSLNLNTEPICIYPSEFYGRIDSILRLTESLHKHVKDFSDYDVINRVVDFDKVNNILDNERNKADNFIRNVMNNVKEAN